MRHMALKKPFVICIILLPVFIARTDIYSGNAAPAVTPFILSDDGGWCWFQGPRVAVVGDYVVIGSVANGRTDSLRAGNVEAIVFDFRTGESTVVILHDSLEANDHATPAFLVRPDGRLLAIYTMHHQENNFYYRISEPYDPKQWGPVRTFTPSEETTITYSNAYLLADENNRIYNFFRGLDNSFKPSFAWSDDLGDTWESGSVFIDVPTEFRHRPYVRYAGDGTGKIHMIYTEGHPRDYPNSLYHIYYEGEVLYESDGTPVRRLADGLERPEDGTMVYQGHADSVAWATDIVLDAQGHPRIAFSVTVGSAGLPRYEGGDDHRFYYGRWDGDTWHVHEMAYAGNRLVSGEDEYTGLVSIDPRNPEVVYISTDADPGTGAALISEADGERRHELFRGETTDGGQSWSWTAITENSSANNIRPMIAPGANGRALLTWLRGEYHWYTDYDTEVMGLVLN